MCLKNWSVPSEIKSIEDKQERVILDTFCSLRSLNTWFLLIFIRRHIFPCEWHTISWNTPRVSFIGGFFFTNFICCLDCYIILHRDWNILWRRDHFTLQRNLIVKLHLHYCSLPSLSQSFILERKGYSGNQRMERTKSNLKQIKKCFEECPLKCDPISKRLLTSPSTSHSFWEYTDKIEWIVSIFEDFSSFLLIKEDKWLILLKRKSLEIWLLLLSAWNRVQFHLQSLIDCILISQELY